ncbi:MAG: acyltransferase family protein [Lachnospiraceae bacterium]|nr:acyltransferase family protein [Lachnospiraceae bacterium]
MVFVFYPLLALLLFAKAKVARRGEWNEEALSFHQTKALLGFLAIIILFHHASQRICAPWLPPEVITHGLDAFVYVGYLCVAVFFCFSGYGMYTAYRSKAHFFKGYFVKHILPIVLPAVVMWLVFYAIERGRGMKIDPPVVINAYSYIWYIPAIVFLYLIFWIAFGLVKTEKAGLCILLIGTIIYSVLCFFLGAGTWWYNTHHLFIVGVLVGKYKEQLLRVLKRGYVIWIILTAFITAFGFAISNYYYPIITAFGGRYTDFGHFIAELTGQTVSAFTFSFLVLLIGMKVRIGNRLLSFLGVFTLELYLVHPLFVQLLGFSFVDNVSGPVFYIKDQTLYLLAVIALSIPLSFLLHKGVQKLCRKDR